MHWLRDQLILAALVLVAACASSAVPRSAGFCTLQGAELEQRKAWVRSLVDQHANGLRELNEGFVLRFRDEGRVKDELDQLVAAERECCTTIQWDVVRAGDGRSVLLAVHASASVSKQLLELFGAEHQGLAGF